MEIFHATMLRCPQMSVQGFVQALCDLHSYPIAGGLREQFSICYDVFIAILENVEHCIMKELGRDNIDWRLRNCCPAWTFELNGEEQLEFCMLSAMDGNDSLKHIPRNNSRDGGGSYILPRSEVDCWSKEVIGDAETVKTEELTPCEECWKNMLDNRTSKMWGVFEETGFFLSLCHHGSVLLGADMVKSGEQAKYPLAIVSRLLKVFGERLGMGYDIGCKFGGTLAKAKKFCVLVGLFHGHTHNRLCQLQHLGMYLTGLGLEDLETLERFFSKSNALAGGIRYASHFHRRQRITWYLRHINRFESFEHISKFLCNNYHQALQIIETEPALKKSMRDLGVAHEKEFDSWLKEEATYLSGLQREPPEETVEMEYFARLVHYYALDLIFAQIQSRSKCKKWVKNEQRVAMRTYRQCLDRLEGLIVSRIFELMKMNMSHTGYKMRKHIGKALQARSQAIWTALSQYNAAAAVLKPPRPALQWERVVEYAFLADFDLLRDVQQDMSQRKWAAPAGRKAMDTYFKICHAKEEIRRLNIEIRRVITYMHTEDIYLQHHEKALVTTSPTLALQDESMDIDNDDIRHAVDSENDDSDDEEQEKAINEEVEAIMQISGDNGRD
ncbi:hypothetical protein EDD18DRAFT_1309780 [Armillaria luteobubalina]|uniref:CxC1-like cysteine cluster associated with KDZ transposases domain-containing protein n=1 Tax=Armillaria luteobubalina TaxID=153913 RepID=A0AA39Q6D5_9AGAR|nr:hypothetical protein EDD18DRAFT_1309780 [Armillaria luteobubalina]